MLVAEYDGERIEIQNYDDPKTELKRDLLRCQVCNQSLFIKDGLIKVAHFSHYADAACNFEKRQGEPETLAHRMLKIHILNSVQSKNPTAKVSLEYPILDGKRIADVHVEYESGNKRLLGVNSPALLRRRC